MFKIMRWSLAGMMLAASAGVQAAGDMERSFDAAIGGNFHEAVSIWKDLAAQGNAQAQFNLGTMYHGGLGLPRDEQKAVELYHAAAQGGYNQARVYLAVGYQEGWFGLPKDESKAYYWRGMLNE